MLFGIPERDLSKTWTNCNVITTSSGVTPLLNEREAMRAEVNVQRNVKLKRHGMRPLTNISLYIAGK